MNDIITKTNRNWAGLIGGGLVAAALLFPFISIGDNAAPFDHYLNAAYGYDNPELDYGNYAKERVMMHALPAPCQEGPENGVILNADTEVMEPPIQPVPEGNTVLPEPTPFQGRLPQAYTGNGHQ